MAGQGTYMAKVHEGLRPPGRGVGVLMAIAAVTFGIASAVHFGDTIPLGFVTVHDPYPGAKFPEMIIGAVMAAGSVPVLARMRFARLAGTIATGFAVLGTLAGLHFTLGGGRMGDLEYHFGVLTLLVVTFALLYLPRASRRSE